jgi:hypothetical protein
MGARGPIICCPIATDPGFRCCETPLQLDCSPAAYLGSGYACRILRAPLGWAYPEIGAVARVPLLGPIVEVPTVDEWPVECRREQRSHQDSSCHNGTKGATAWLTTTASQMRSAGSQVKRTAPTAAWNLCESGPPVVHFPITAPTRARQPFPREEHGVRLGVARRARRMSERGRCPRRRTFSGLAGRRPAQFRHRRGESDHRKAATPALRSGPSAVRASLV